MYEQYSVLFVDDEVNILHSLKRGLVYETYTCYFASSGKEALEMLKKTEIAVIVSDMRMPEMDGLKLLKEVQERYPRIVKMILSGYTQLPQILTTINQVDIFKFITKPWKLEEEFKVAIYKALDYYRLHQENEEIKIALQNKNQAYVNILRNIDETIATAKRNNEILGTCGKNIMAFNKKAYRDYVDGYEFLLDIQERFFDFLTQAIAGDEKEVQSEYLIKEVIQEIQKYVAITKLDIKPGFSQKIKLYNKIAIAILIFCAWILKETFETTGLYVVANVETNGMPIVSLISPNVYGTANSGKETAQVNDIRIGFLNAVIGGLAKMTKLDFHAMISNGSIITLLTLKVIEVNEEKEATEMTETVE